MEQHRRFCRRSIEVERALCLVSLSYPMGCGSFYSMLPPVIARFFTDKWFHKESDEESDKDFDEDSRKA